MVILLDGDAFGDLTEAKGFEAEAFGDGANGLVGADVLRILCAEPGDALLLEEEPFFAQAVTIGTNEFEILDRLFLLGFAFEPFDFARPAVIDGPLLKRSQRRCFREAVCFRILGDAIVKLLQAATWSEREVGGEGRPLAAKGAHGATSLSTGKAAVRATNIRPRLFLPVNRWSSFSSTAWTAGASSGSTAKLKRTGSSAWSRSDSWVS